MYIYNIFIIIYRCCGCCSAPNIYIHTGRGQRLIKLGDFGIARVLKHTHENARYSSVLALLVQKYEY